MDVAVLGALRVTEHGADRTPRGQRSRDLLAALLLRRGQAVEASVLLDLVWGSGSGLMPTVVHTQMARLRRDIGGDRVLRSELGYRLTGVDVDVDRFTDLVAQARGIGQSETTITLLREALDHVARRPPVRRRHRGARRGGDHADPGAPDRGP